MDLGKAGWGDVDWIGLAKAHMGNRRTAGRMRPSTSFDPALIHFSEVSRLYADII
jgi:hypothetical protein